MGLRGRLHLGPALRRLRLPVRSTLVSVIFHAAFGAAVLWGNAVWGGSEPKPVIVNLVPAIAAVGVPQGRQQPEQLPPPLRHADGRDGGDEVDDDRLGLA